MNVFHHTLIGIICIIAISAQLVMASVAKPDHAVQGDENTLQHYRHLYKQYKHSNPDTAYYFLEQQKALSEQLENTFMLAKAHFGMAQIDLNAGRYDASISHYLQAAQLHRDLNNYLHYADAISDLGFVSLKAGNWENARRFFNRSFVVYDHFKDTISLINVHLNLGYAYLQLDDMAKAENHYQEALYFAQLKNLPSALNQVYNYLGELENTRCHFNRSRYYYQQSIIGSHQLDNKVHLAAIAYNNISESLLTEGHLDSAEYYLIKSLEIKRTHLHDSNSIMIGLLNYGILEQRRGNSLQAANLLEEGVSMADRQVINFELGKTLTALNDVYKDIIKEGGDIDQGKHLLQKDIWSEQHNMLVSLKNELQSNGIQDILYYNIQLKQSVDKVAVLHAEQRIQITWLVISAVLCMIIGLFLFDNLIKVRKVKQILFKGDK